MIRLTDKAVRDCAKFMSYNYGAPEGGMAGYIRASFAKADASWFTEVPEASPEPKDDLMVELDAISANVQAHQVFADFLDSTAKALSTSKVRMEWERYSNWAYDLICKGVGDSPSYHTKCSLRVMNRKLRVFSGTMDRKPSIEGTPELPFLNELPDEMRAACKALREAVRTVEFANAYEDAHNFPKNQKYDDDIGFIPSRPRS